jgi:hypothetical protein
MGWDETNGSVTKIPKIYVSDLSEDTYQGEVSLSFPFHNFTPLARSIW